MYAKLDKLRADLKKAVAKRDAADAKVKQLEAKLKEEENLQIVSDVASYNLSPEQLAQFLQLTNSGRLQDRHQCQRQLHPVRRQMQRKIMNRKQITKRRIS